MSITTLPALTAALATAADEVNLAIEDASAARTARGWNLEFAMRYAEDSAEMAEAALADAEALVLQCRDGAARKAAKKTLRALYAKLPR